MIITLLVLAALAGFAGQFLDSWTTKIALDYKWHEQTAWVLWFITKTNVTTLILVKCLGFAGIFPALVYFAAARWGGPPAAMFVMFEGFAAAWGFWAGIKNYKLLKSAKIKVF